MQTTQISLWSLLLKFLIFFYESQVKFIPTRTYHITALEIEINSFGLTVHSNLYLLIKQVMLTLK